MSPAQPANKKRVFILVQDGSDPSLLPALAHYCANDYRTLVLVGPEAREFGLRAGLTAGQFDPRPETPEHFLETLIRAQLDQVSCAVLLGSVRLLSPQILTYGDSLVIDLRKPVDQDAMSAAHAVLAGQTAPDTGGAKLSLISSIFRAGAFMEGFLFNITQMEGYEGFCDHFFLFAGTDAVEERLLLAHFATYANAIHVWHETDPGLYECWNIGARLARTPYLSNANVDDLRHPRQGPALVDALEDTPQAAIAASALLPFETYQSDYRTIPVENPWYADQAGIFDLADMGHLSESQLGERDIIPHNLPHCMPVWRRRLHEQYGYFDEDIYGTYADWAFWMHCMRGGEKGVLTAEALSYYFINPTSHNRRGDRLQAFHDRVVSEFRPLLEHALAARHAAAASGDAYARKLNLRGHDQNFGQHRNAFNRLIQALMPLEKDGAGIQLLPFIERRFVWGTDPGEAASAQPAPITTDWIGILHVPFDAPEWFDSTVSPEMIFKTSLWQQSLPACRGIICLSEDLATDFRLRYPEIPVLGALHPTELGVVPFNMTRYRRHRRVVQVGDWLRKLQAIFELSAPRHDKIMLLKNDTLKYLQKDIAQFGDRRGAPAVRAQVDQRLMVSNEEYDDLLSSAVVLCLLYGTAANNVVIECMVRATPIIVNPLPGVVDYLGRKYPLYAETVGRASELLRDDAAIHAAHLYLKTHTPKAGLTYDDFLHKIGSSDFYKGL